MVDTRLPDLDVSLHVALSAGVEQGETEQAVIPLAWGAVIDCCLVFVYGLVEVSFHVCRACGCPFF